MKHQLQTIRAALTAAANLIAHQYSSTSLGMTALQDASDDCLEALAALSELERMAGEQEPVAAVRVLNGRLNGTRRLPGMQSLPDGDYEMFAAPPAQQPQSITPAELAKRIERGEKWEVAQQPQAEAPMLTNAFLADVMTAAGLVSHGKQCKALGERLGAEVARLRMAAPQQTEEKTVYRLAETDIYDFAGWLTTRPGVMEVGSSKEAGPMAEAVGEYLRAYPERFAPQQTEAVPSDVVRDAEGR